MSYNLDGTHVLDLVHILADNQIDEKVISKALEFICGCTSFDCGLVYELDSSEQFCLMEHYASDCIPFSDSFSANTFLTKCKEYLDKGAVSYLEKGQNTLAEKCLLEVFKTESLIFAPIMDEKVHLLGFLVLLNKESKRSLTANDVKITTAMLSVVIQCLTVKIYNKKLHLTQSTLANVLDNTGIDIYVNDFYTHEILYVNKSMAAPYGGVKQFVGKKCWQVLFPDKSGPCDFCPQEKLIDDKGQPTGVYSWDYQRPFDGLWFRVFSAAYRWVDGRLAHIVSSADITENKCNEMLIEELANYDQLTKLPNRRMLVNECARRIDKAMVTEQGYLLFFDIDGFKKINDSLGHDAGDEFLIQLGEFFSSIPLLRDSIYRNGGDEFVAIVGGEMLTKANIRSLAYFILERFRRPWELKKGEVFSNTSIGIACHPEDGATAEQLLQKADQAMYQVKKAGGGGVCFGYELNAENCDF